MAGDGLLDRFRDEGWVRLTGAFSAGQAGAMREVVWRHVEKRTNVREARPDTWAEAAAGSFGLRSVEGRSVFSPFVENEAVFAALDAIFGVGGWRRPATWRPQILLTFPQPRPWAMPAGWHIDFGDDEPTWPVFAVKLFGFFDEVEPEGGGTLLLARSHHLVQRPLPVERLPPRGTADDPQRQLVGHTHEIDGIPLRVVELTGQPGDVVIAHMHVLHSPSPNTGRRPRQMLGFNIGRAPT